MILEFHSPAYPLNQYIESFVYHKNFSATHSIDRFLPDGHVNIVIDLTDYPKYIYDNHTLKEIQSCRNVWFSGIRTGFITIPAGRDSEMFVINFRKGKAYPFAEMPMDQLTNCVVDGELVLTNEILNMRDGLLGQSTPQGKFVYAERYLLKYFGKKLTRHACVDYAVNEIVTRPNNLTISELTSKIGYSQKHFISMFSDHVGITPKAFLRIIRFQKSIAEIETSRHVSWSQVALDSGYYDQAHFINDFRNFSGFTPQQYLESRGAFLNYLAVG